MKVLTHDFPDPKTSKAVPYGIYDIARNAGWVNIGTSSDTAEFAVESIYGQILISCFLYLRI